MSTAGLELPYPRVSQAKFRDETSRRGKKCKVCETLICKLVNQFIVFGEHGRYIGNINCIFAQYLFTAVTRLPEITEIYQNHP